MFLKIRIFSDVTPCFNDVSKVRKVFTIRTKHSQLFLGRLTLKMRALILRKVGKDTAYDSRNVVLFMVCSKLLSVTASVCCQCIFAW